MPGSGVVRAAILQAKWTGDTASMIEVHEGYARTAAQQGAQDHGLPGGLQRALLLPGPGGRALPLGRAGARRADGARACRRWPARPAWCSSCRSSRSSSAGYYYNTAAVIDADGTVLGKYRKHHIPQVKGFWEKYYFRPGNLGLAGVRHRRRHGSASTSATTGTSPRAGARWGWPARRSSSTRRPPAAACRRTCGSWSSPRPPWPTSTSSPRSTGSASEEYGDNDFYGTSYFVDPRGQFVGDVGERQRRGARSSATSTST